MKKERERSIDLFKILLVLGMVLCHCIQLIGHSSRISTAASVFINLVTFSGFLFCFGYAISIAYLGKNRGQVYKKLIKNCIKLLAVFYISGIGFEILVSKNFSLFELIKIILLFRIPGYSEFLAGFFALNFLTLIFFNQFKKILSNKIYFIIVLVVSLIANFIPYNYIWPNQIGLIVGSTKFASFPVLQYLSYYILGAYFQKNKVKFNLKYFMASIISTLIFVSYVFIYKKLPLRFPPSIFWILGGAGFLYVYYIFSIYVSNKIKKLNKLYVNKLYFIGENTLYFLLGSNLIIFLLKYNNLKMSFILCIIADIVIILVSYIIIYVCKRALKFRYKEKYIKA